MHIGNELRELKLAKLLEVEGYDSLEEMLEAVFSDSASPAICIEPHCDNTAEMEPDQTEGYCESCGGQTMVAAPILAGII